MQAQSRDQINILKSLILDLGAKCD